jgi:hypothetical protein
LCLASKLSSSRPLRRSLSFSIVRTLRERTLLGLDI